MNYYADARQAITAAEIEHNDAVTSMGAQIDALTAERDEWRFDALHFAAEYDDACARIAELEALLGPTRDELAAAYGVCVHPNYLVKPYWADTATWMGHLNAMGVKHIRGMFNPANAGCMRTLDLCRAYGIKWLMTVAPEDWTMTNSVLQKRVAWIVANAADVCYGIENINEPDHSRDSTPVPTDWPQRVLAYQKIIDTGVAGTGILSVSSALHDVNQDKLNGAGFRALSQLGISEYVDVVSLHSYPKGSEITTGLDDRLTLVDLAYAGKPVLMSETGWTTYTRVGSGGPVPTTEEDAAIYGSEGIATIAQHPRLIRAYRFEELDDPSDGTDPETRYGLIRPDGTWKPEATAIKNKLAA